MRVNIKRSLLVALGLLLGSTAATSLTSLARELGPDEDPRMLPYSGQLESGGASYQGSADFSVTVTNADGSESWTEQHEDIQVRDGEFSLLLGSVQGQVPDWFYDSTAIYLSMNVRDGDSEGDFAQLDGWQRIVPSAWSWWAAEADQLEVAGDVTTNSTLEMSGGTLQTGTVELQSAADLTVEGAFRARTYNNGGLSWPTGYLQYNNNHVRIDVDNAAGSVLGPATYDGEALTLPGALGHDVVSLSATTLAANGRETSGSLLEVYNNTYYEHESNDDPSYTQISHGDGVFCAMLYLSSEDPDAACEVRRVSSSVTRIYYNQNNFGECGVRCITWN